MKISEFGLIERFRKRFGSHSPSLKLGIGDDAAVLKSPRYDLLFTCDCAVEGVHFDLSYFSFYDVGHRIACANLSDIAAMGGKPYAAVVTLGVRFLDSLRLRSLGVASSAAPGINRGKSEQAARNKPGLSEKNLLELYKGMTVLLSKFGCPIAGGDIVRSPKLFVDMAMIGTAGKKIFKRSGAKAGELVVVTGDLGRSLLGFKLLLKARKRCLSVLTEKHLRPSPRLLEAEFLQKRIKVGAMMDVSDGLSSELHHLAKESGVGFIIDEEKIPLHPALVLQAKKQGLPPTQLALSSGEEYELLFTCPVWEEKKLLAWNRSQKGAPFTVIGQVVKGNKKVWLKKKSRRMVEIKPTGHRHF